MCDSGFSFSLSRDDAILDSLLFLLHLCVTLSLSHTPPCPGLLLFSSFSWSFSSKNFLCFFSLLV